jgi:hypothetical protein
MSAVRRPTKFRTKKRNRIRETRFPPIVATLLRLLIPSRCRIQYCEVSNEHGNWEIVQALMTATSILKFLWPRQHLSESSFNSALVLTTWTHWQDWNLQLRTFSSNLDYNALLLSFLLHGVRKRDGRRSRRVLREVQSNITARSPLYLLPNWGNRSKCFTEN